MAGKPRLYVVRSGKKLSYAELSRRTGISVRTLQARRRAGLKPDFAGDYRKRMVWIGVRQQSATDWARELGISPATFYSRLRRNLAAEKLAHPGPMAHAKAGRLFIYKGKTQNMAAWGRELGISRERVRQRLAKYGIEEALSGVRHPGGGQVKLIRHGGKEQTGAEWAAALGLSTDTIRRRIRRGLSLDEALVPGRCGSLGRVTRGKVSLTVKEWALRLGISLSAMYTRVRAFKAGRIGEAEVFASGRHPGRPRKVKRTI